MIAIVILGLGLVLVASMFPIAWQRARDLADFTNSSSCTDSAEVTVKALCHVTRPGVAAMPGSFVGDYATYQGGVTPVLEPVPYTTPAPVATANRVRPLLVENVYATWNPTTAPLNIVTGAKPVAFPDLDTGAFNNGFMAFPSGIIAPQVAFQDRVFPPMPPLPQAPGLALDQWLQQLATRRLAWDVLTRLELPRAGPDPTQPATVVPVIIDGGNLKCDTTADVNDVQVHAYGDTVPAGAVVVRPGTDQVLTTSPGDDDEQTTELQTGSGAVPAPLEGIYEPLANGNGAANTMVVPFASDDVQVIPLGQQVSPGQLIVAAGPDGILQTAPAGDDVRRGQPLRVEQPRSFTMYYVTLKRTDTTRHFAQQYEKDPLLTPARVNPANPQPPLTPADVMAQPDLLFPVPWRVQIKVNPNVTPPTAQVPNHWRPPTGIPSTAIVPDPSATAATALTPVQREALIGMFPVGQVFIDEVSGQVYRVVRRTLLNIGDPATQSAVLTLDKEIQLSVDTIDDGGDGDYTKLGFALTPPTTEWGSWTLDDPDMSGPLPGEDIRTVWVYPPPIERGPGAGNFRFDGPSPVAGLEIRKLTIAP